MADSHHTITATTDGRTSTSKKCHLLSLPAELRLLIYEAYFPTYDFDDGPASAWSEEGVQPALLNTCGQFLNEGLKAYRERLCEIQLKQDETRRALGEKIVSSWWNTATDDQKASFNEESRNYFEARAKWLRACYDEERRGDGWRVCPRKEFETMEVVEVDE